jgi:hypothetical protein
MEAIETDPATDIQGDVNIWIELEKSEHKVGRTNRHRQVGLAKKHTHNMLKNC